MFNKLETQTKIIRSSCYALCPVVIKKYFFKSKDNLYEDK